MTNRQRRSRATSVIVFGGVGETTSEKTEGGFMKDLIIEQIERRARLEHGGDFSKAAR